MSTWTCLGFKVLRGGGVGYASCKHLLTILITCLAQNCKSINRECISLSYDSHNFLIALGKVFCFLQPEPANACVRVSTIINSAPLTVVDAHVCSQECLCVSQQLYIQHTLTSNAEVPTKNASWGRNCTDFLIPHQMQMCERGYMCTTVLLKSGQIWGPNQMHPQLTQTREAFDNFPIGDEEAADRAAQFSATSSPSCSHSPPPSQLSQLHKAALLDAAMLPFCATASSTGSSRSILYLHTTAFQRLTASYNLPDDAFQPAVKCLFKKTTT